MLKFRGTMFRGAMIQLEFALRKKIKSGMGLMTMVGR